MGWLAPAASSDALPSVLGHLATPSTWVSRSTGGCAFPSLDPAKGLMGMLLRYPYEVRDAAEYFDDIQDVKITKDMLDLAKHIVETKAGHFEPAKFEDHYEAALQELLEKKQKGQPIAAAKKAPSGNVYNLMDALRASIKGDQRTPAEKPTKAAKMAKSARPAAKRKAG